MDHLSEATLGQEAGSSSHDTEARRCSYQAAPRGSALDPPPEQGEDAGQRWAGGHTTPTCPLPDFRHVS